MANRKIFMYKKKRRLHCLMIAFADIKSIKDTNKILFMLFSHSVPCLRIQFEIDQHNIYALRLRNL